MSTIREVLARVDQRKPNAFTAEQKVAWISALEGRIAIDVFLMDISEAEQFQYQAEADQDTKLLIRFPHDDLYDLWLYAQIDMANGEYDKYQNAMIQYNEAFSNFVKWFARVYAPAQGYGGAGYEPAPGVPVYYITAYGLAVMQGFTGTLDEWLNSLVGQTAYDLAVELGFEGSPEDWLESLHGQPGKSVEVDTTLSKAGMAADAAVAGTLLAAANSTAAKALKAAENAQSAAGAVCKPGDGEQSAIINDPSNQALSDNTTAMGYGTVAGGKGFEVLAIKDGVLNDDGTPGTGYYTLSSVTGLEVGMEYSVKMESFRCKAGKIRNVNPENNTITVDGYKRLGFDDELNYLTIVGRPDLGDIDVGFNASVSGEGNIVQDRSGDSSGRDNKVIGAYGSARNRGNIAGYCADAGGRGTKALADQSRTGGKNTTVWSKNSSADGEDTEAGQPVMANEDLHRAAAARGIRTKAKRAASTSDGIDTVADAKAASVRGIGGYAGSEAQEVSGKYNVKDTAGKYAEIVGNGESDTKRSNARTLDWDGNEQLAGDLKIRNGLGGLGKGTDGEILMESTDASGNNYRRLVLRNPTAKDDNKAALVLHVKKNGGSVSGFALYGEHNKPTPAAIGAAPASTALQMLGDINSVDALPADEACLFRALDSNWGGVLPLTYAAYARLRSGPNGNYTTWLGGNGANLYYTMTSDGDKPTAESWKRIAFTNEVVQPADMAAALAQKADAGEVATALSKKADTEDVDTALAQKAPAGFGYGEKMTYLIESENLNPMLDEILSTMADQTAKQIQIYDQSFSTVAYICTLWRFTGDYALVDAVSYGGYRAVKCKWGGTWYPWTWENPPMIPGQEYRTTQMWNGRTVHVKALQGAMPSGGASIELPIMNGSQIVSIEALYYVSGEDCAYFFNVGEGATLSAEFNTLQLYYAGSEEANYRIIVKYVED